MDLKRRMAGSLVIAAALVLSIAPRATAQEWSVELDGCTYTNENFEGRAYADTAPCSGFLPALYSFAQHASKAWVGTSGTSLAVGTGSKSLTLEEGTAFAVGQPVRIAAVGSESTNFMDGVVTAWNETTKAMTVSVNASTGSGTYTSWRVMVVRALTTIASPPVAISQGGTGATTIATARTNLETPHLYDCAAVEQSAAAAEVFVGVYAPDCVLTLGSGTLSGAFVGHPWEIANYQGGGSWTFEVPTEPAVVWSRDADQFWECYRGGGEGNVNGCRRLSQLPPTLTRTAVNYTIPFDSQVLRWYIEATNTAGSITITLPSTATAAGYAWTINRVGTQNVVINVASSGTINGAASYTLTTLYQSVTVVQSTTAGVYFTR